MKWLKDQDIQDFLSKYNYDIRVHSNARWIDQKCATDVVSIVADCIVQYAENNSDAEFFTSMDIWRYEYTVDHVEAIFKKPSPDAKMLCISGKFNCTYPNSAF